MSYSGGVHQSRPNSSMAVVSLIAGILGLTMFPVIGSIVALITGSMAKKEIARSGGALEGYGLAKAGIIMGWIGIGLMFLGLCIAGFAIGLPLCLAALGAASGEFGLLIPALGLLV